MEIKLNEKRDKYFNLPRELRKLWNMNVTVILIVIGTIATVPNDLKGALEELEVVGRAEIIQTTILFKIGQNTEKSPGYLRL